MCNVYINWIPIFVLVMYIGLFINYYGDWGWYHRMKNILLSEILKINAALHIYKQLIYKIMLIRMPVYACISNKNVSEMLYFKFFFKIKLSMFLLAQFMERWTIFVHIRTHFTYKIDTVTPFLHINIGIALLRIIWLF